MDNEKQKQEVIDFLESTYTGAKMMGDDEVMLRASRALLQLLIPVMIFFSIPSRVTPLTILALKQRRR